MCRPRGRSDPYLLSTTHPFELDRYLVAYDPRRVPHFRFDVVVLGGGAAGALAALSAANAGANVAVICKRELTDGNTQWAKGGVAAVLDKSDSFDVHVSDTLAVGCGLCEESVVEHVVRAGPAGLQRLLDIGTEFDRTPDGQLQLSKEGGHTHPRIVHAHGDATGVEIQRALSAALEGHERITCFPGHFAIDLISDAEGHVAGVLCRAGGQRVAFAATQVVLATGGSGQIYRETTNPVIATGDGVAMGMRAGAVLRDLEFIQFHPTCLYIAGAARVLISEIVRGAGGLLRDRQGERFMPHYHEAAELAPRDVVSRAVFERMVATQDTSVYMDLSELKSDPHAAFPAISRICGFFGIDIARDPIPVRPGAHYQVGGLWVDSQGRTSVPGLWAVGECASTGLHGANRMGSNSLLEAIVLGEQTGRLAAETAGSHGINTGTTLAVVRDEAPPEVKVNLDDLTYSLKSMMWRQMGVERNGEGLRDALEKINFWTRALRAVTFESESLWELQNMLLVARVATIGALSREESRGVHFRTDHPERSEAWAGHLEMHPEVEGGEVRALRQVLHPVGTSGATSQ